jgi:predicted GNAT family N-acyltransferase
MIKLTSKKSLELSKEEIDSICFLKNTYWKFGLNSQMKWFKKNVNPNDLHNMLIINDKLVGYTLLRIKKIKLNSIRKYFIFDTLIIKKKFRKKKLSDLLMKFNNKIIKKNKKVSFLICRNKMVKFYQKYKWIKIQKKTFKVIGHPFNTNGMVFNYAKKCNGAIFYI